MTAFEFSGPGFASVTPLGAFYATSEPGKDNGREVLTRILARQAAPAVAEIPALLASDDSLIEALYRLQQLGMIEAVDAAVSAPSGALETVLPALLGKLASQGKAVLADPHGFYIATSGFPHEVAEEIAALSADLAALDTRHRRMLGGNLGLHGSAWALVDAGGASALGFVPIYVAGNRFVLVVSGRPQLRRFAFAEMVWALCARYSAVSAAPETKPLAISGAGSIEV